MRTYLLLLYDYVEDMASRRAPFREDHLNLVQQLHERGLLVMAGAWADPLDGAALLFRVEERGPIEEFVTADPYVRNGLVTRWQIRQWNVVVGGEG